MIFFFYHGSTLNPKQSLLARTRFPACRAGHVYGLVTNSLVLPVLRHSTENRSYYFKINSRDYPFPTGRVPKLEHLE